MKTLRFQKVDGTPVKNIVNHILNVLTKHPDAEIHVGTDSQVYPYEIKYVTVIAFKYGTRGTHYIYAPLYVEKKDFYPRWMLKVRSEDSLNNQIEFRLRYEVELSIDLAVKIKEDINVDLQIDIDFNVEPGELDQNKSNKLIGEARGWSATVGCKANLKPNDQYATKAANHHCQTLPKRNKKSGRKKKRVLRKNIFVY